MEKKQKHIYQIYSNMLEYDGIWVSMCLIVHFHFFSFYSGPGSWEMLRYGLYWFIMHEQGATQDFFSIL